MTDESHAHFDGGLFHLILFAVIALGVVTIIMLAVPESLRWHQLPYGDAATGTPIVTVPVAGVLAVVVAALCSIVQRTDSEKHD